MVCVFVEREREALKLRGWGRETIVHVSLEGACRL